MHLNFTIKSSFFNEINYRTWGDFRKKFRHRGQNYTEKSSRVFVEDAQWSKICSTANSTWQAKHKIGQFVPIYQITDSDVWQAKHRVGVPPRSVQASDTDGGVELNAFHSIYSISTFDCLLCRAKRSRRHFNRAHQIISYRAIEPGNAKEKLCKKNYCR